MLCPRTLVISVALLTLVQCDSPEDGADPWPRHLKPVDVDVFTRALQQASNSSDQSHRVVAHLPSLQAIYKRSPAVLQQYLEASPAWRVQVRSDGTRFAKRRIQIGGEWKYKYAIGRSDLSTKAHKPEEYWRLDLIVNLNGDPTKIHPAHHLIRATHQLKFGQAIELPVEEMRGAHAEQTKPSSAKDLPPSYSSQILIQEEGLAVEIWEFSGSANRRMTRAAIEAMEKEFAALRARIESGEFEAYIRTLGTVGEPRLVLRSNPPSQGFYGTQLFINPGEPGTVFLKAFRHPSGEPIFEHDGVNERIGWSDDARIKFYANSDLPNRHTNQPYEIRLEVWFAPDNGDKSRKLLERQFSLLPPVL